MGAASGPCQCPGQKENVIDLQIPAYSANGGTGDVPAAASGQQPVAGWDCCCSESGEKGGDGTQFHNPDKPALDYVVPHMTNPYSADMKTGSSPENVPPLDQQDFALREETGHTYSNDDNADDRTPAEWGNDQEQFSNLPPLLEGWIRVRSRTTGEIYYCFTQTGETTFTEPTAAPSASDSREQMASRPQEGDLEPLPPGWVEVVSKSSGKIYYWNAVLQKSQFTRPTAADSIPEGGESAQLPPGWIKMKSKSTGKDYYFNSDTQTSQFEIPT